jgi:hypothetical protein
MLTLVLPIVAAITCALIEYCRIYFSYGEVDNINKLWTVTIGVIMFIFCLAMSVSYYDDIMPGDVMSYMVYYAGWRGLMYDVTLNILRGLRFDYISATTNSIIDRLFVRKSTFWTIKFVYLLIVIIFGYLWQLR